ncbi:MAG: flagellar basal body-associated FliL family protein [Pseudomonadota bacterium]
MKYILPIALLLFGSAAGVAAGIFLKPATQGEDAVLGEQQNGSETPSEPSELSGKSSAKDDTDLEYVELSNQFVVPIVKNERIASMVVAALSLEVAQGSSQTVLDKEPKLRSEFLRVFFDHANMGGFSGTFTELNTLSALQRALVEVAQKIIGAEIVSDVLIYEIARQDY